MRRCSRVQAAADGLEVPPWISGHRTRGPASGLERVIYVIYARKRHLWQIRQSLRAKRSNPEVPAHAIEFAPANWIASSLCSSQ